MIANNTKAFTTLFLLLILPLIITLITLTYYTVFLIELKNEFRFKCITESLQIMTKNLNDDNTKKSVALLDILKKINSPIKHSVKLSDYSKSEILTQNSSISGLAYELKSSLTYELAYEWIQKFKLICGTQIIRKGTQWHSKIIYETTAVRF